MNVPQFNAMLTKSMPFCNDDECLVSPLYVLIKINKANGQVREPQLKLFAQHSRSERKSERA